MHVGGTGFSALCGSSHPGLKNKVMPKFTNGSCSQS